MLQNSKMMRDHMLRGVHQHRGEFAVLIDKFPFVLKTSRWAGSLDQQGGVILSRYLLQEDASKAARIYLRLVCDSMMMRREITSTQVSDVFDRFGLDMIFESSLDLYRIANEDFRKKTEWISVIGGSIFMLLVFLKVVVFDEQPVSEAREQQIAECELVELREARIAGRPANREKCREMTK